MGAVVAARYRAAMANQPAPARRFSARSYRAAAALLVLLALPVLLGGCGAPGWQGQAPAQLRDYQAAFERDAGTRFVGSATGDEFLRLATHARVLWLGDHHRDLALHGRQLALLQQLHERGVRCCLGLEAIGVDDQPAVAAFLAGHGDVDELAQRLRARWPGSWLDAGDVDREHYRALLQFARDSHTPVFALEPTPRLPLPRRDAVIAASVQTAAERNPDRLVVTIVGQAHLLGDGRVPLRSELPSLLVGAVPPPGLAARAPMRLPRHGFVRSDGGLWFFADLLPPR